MIDDDDISSPYLDRLKQQQALSSPAVEALRKYSSPEEFAALAPQLGIAPEAATQAQGPLAPKIPGQYADLATKAAEKHGVPIDLVGSVMRTESAGNPGAISPKGASGLMQLMPGTAADMGVTDPMDPAQNIEGGVKYLRLMLDRYQGDQTRALVAYNWGPGNADKWSGNAKDLPAETRDYLKKTMGRNPGASMLSMPMMPQEQAGIEGSWRTTPVQDLSAPEKPKAEAVMAQETALDLLLKGWKPEEIEAEISGGITEPLYGPPDLLADVASGGLSSAGRSAVKAIAGGAAEEGGKALAKSVITEAVTGAMAGGMMTAAEAAGAGPIIQAMAGLIGPTATVALMQLPRKGMATFLKQLEYDNPNSYSELLDAVDNDPSPLAKRIKKVFEMSKGIIANERGGFEVPGMRSDTPLRPLPFEQDPAALLKIDAPRLESLESNIIADKTTIEMLQKYAGNINLERIDDAKTPDDIRNVINTVAETIPVELDEARRGSISFEARKALADDLGMSEESLLKRQRGQAFNAEQVIASRWIMMDSANKLLEMAKRVRGGENSDEMLAAFRDRLSRHAAIQSQVAGMTAEAGRALQSFRIVAETGQLRMRDIQGVLEQAGGRDNVEKMAEVLTDLADSNGGKLDLGKVNAATKKLHTATKIDAVMEAWIMGLLSGPQTHMVNMLSNSLTAMWMVPERKLASWISQSPIGSGEVQAGEATAQMFGMVEGFKDGLRAASLALKRGEGTDLAGKIETPRRAIQARTFGADESSVLGRGIDLLGEAIRMPGRFLTAEDELFKTVGYRMEVQAQAFRQATAEGLDGDRLAARIVELSANPPDNIKLAAIDAAHYQTFTNQLGQTGRLVQAAVSSHPALRVIVPFIKTPTNIMKFAIERSPIAPVMSNVRADIAAGGVRRDMALAKIGLGSTIMATSGSMAAAGLITGGGPADKDMREILKRKGWQPYSVKVGDTYVSYNRLDPVGATLGMAADFAEICGQAGEMEGEKLAGAIVASISQNMLSKTYLRGISDFTQVFTEAQRYENANRGEAYIRKLLGSTVPAFLAQIERTTDPTIEDTSRFKGMDAVFAEFKSRIPGYSEDLPPRRNLWGEVMVMGGGLGPDILSPLYTSEEKSSPVDDELLRLKLPVKLPPPNIQGVELKPEEYDRLVKLSGNAYKDPSSGLGLKDSLAQLIKSEDYKRQSDGEDGGKSLVIRQYVRAYREMAKAQVLEEFPELKELVNEKLQQDAQARQPRY